MDNSFNVNSDPILSALKEKGISSLAYFLFREFEKHLKY